MKKQIATTDITGPLPMRARTDFPDGRPRVLDLDLGAFLELSRSRDIRKLIKQELDTKNLNDSDVCAVQARAGASAGSAPQFGRMVTEYWLTEEAALFVASRSETKRGAEVLRALISFFEALKVGGFAAARLIEICFRDLPRKLQPRFVPLLSALATLRSEVYDGGTAPPWARGACGMVYDWALPGCQKHRRKLNSELDHHDYENLNDDGLQLLDRTIGICLFAAENAHSWEHWRDMMRRKFEGKSYQPWLPWGAPNKQLPPKPRRGRKAA